MACVQRVQRRYGVERTTAANTSRIKPSLVRESDLNTSLFIALLIDYVPLCTSFALFLFS